MLQMGRRTRTLTPRRVKLSWLLLLTFTAGLVVVVHYYFICSSASSGAGHQKVTRDSSWKRYFGIRTSEEFLNSNLHNAVTEADAERNDIHIRQFMTANMIESEGRVTPGKVRHTFKTNTEEVASKNTETDSRNSASNDNLQDTEGETEIPFFAAASSDPDLITTTGEYGVVLADQENGGNVERVRAVERDGIEENQELRSEPVEHSDVLETQNPLIQVHNVPRDGEKVVKKDVSHSKSTGDLYKAILIQYILNKVNYSNSNCSQPPLFRSWKNCGIVTQMGKPLKRDCHKLREDPALEMRQSNLTSQLQDWKSSRPWEAFALKYKKMSCDEIRDEFNNNFYVSQVEKDFPIAYIFVVYTNAGQVLRLLKSIYRPQNLYCIHPDARQGKRFKEFFTTVAKCLDNVFVVSKPVKVYYGHISITNAQLQCMQDLEKYPQSRWRYVINLCGREVPVKTNREIVESLMKLRGYSALHEYPLPKTYWEKRFLYKFRLNDSRMEPTKVKQAKPPKGIELYKSMNFIAASRAFVHFLLYDPLSQKLHSYLSTVYDPEEHFYSSLYALPQAKGARPPKKLLGKYDMPIVDNFIWVNRRWQVKNRRKYCPGGKIVHGICILTAQDMGRIEQLGVRSQRPVFFFNKYFLEWDPTAMDCMEERLVQANMDEYRRDCMPNYSKTNEE